MAASDEILTEIQNLVFAVQQVKGELQGVRTRVSNLDKKANGLEEQVKINCDKLDKMQEKMMETHRQIIGLHTRLDNLENSVESIKKIG